MASETPYTPMTRTWFNRTFSKLESGNLRTTVFTLASSTIGAGLFALPFVISQLGIILGSVLLGLGGLSFAVYYSILVSIAHTQRIFDLMLLFQERYGHLGRRLVELSTMCLCFGIGTAYVVLVCRIIWSVLVSAGLLAETDFDMWYSVIVIGMTLLFWFPIAIRNKLKALSLFSILSLIASVFLMCLVTVQLPLYIRENPNMEVHIYTLNYDVFSNIGIAFFAFNNAQNITLICYRLEHNTVVRMKRGIYRSYVITTVLYVLLGVMGYVSYTSQTPELLLFRPAVGGGSLYTDWAMFVARVMTGIYLAVAASLDFSALRHCVERFIAGHGHSHSNLRHFAVTIVVLVIADLVAIVQPRPVTYFVVIGGLFATTLSFMVPALLYVHSDTSTWNKAVVLTVAICLWVLGIACAVYEIVFA